MIFTLLHYMYIQQLTSMALQTANIVFYLFANRHIKHDTNSNAASQ